MTSMSVVNLNIGFDTKHALFMKDWTRGKLLIYSLSYYIKCTEILLKCPASYSDQLQKNRLIPEKS